jgi:hypothetical protein
MEFILRKGDATLNEMCGFAQGLAGLKIRRVKFVIS